MILNKLYIKNFKLFKTLEIDFRNINIIKGLNNDNPNQSGNASGKSTLIESIVFGLYGDVSGLNLQDLMRTGEKESEVVLEFLNGTSTIKIIRKIPSSLTIVCDGQEIQANTLKIKQAWIDERFGTLDEFRKFRCIDTKKGINLLELGSISLRKTLMEFMDNIFDQARKNLLAEKNEREQFNISKRKDKFFLSNKRLEILKTGLKKYTTDLAEIRKDNEALSKIIRDYASSISSNERLIYKINETLGKLNISKKCPTCSTLLTSNISEEIIETNKKDKENFEKENLILGQEKSEQEEAQEQISNTIESLTKKQYLTQTYLLKLEQAFKFSEYKYTLKDVEEYSTAIKILDDFALFYISSWLESLVVIMNNLLLPLDLTIKLENNKDFISIYDGETKLKYEQLSSGQKIFLGSIFKLSLMMQNNMMSGLILIDEGINNLDSTNFTQFVNILKSLQYQSFIVYQNVEQLDDVNNIVIYRDNGESKKYIDK